MIYLYKKLFAFAAHILKTLSEILIKLGILYPYLNLATPPFIPHFNVINKMYGIPGMQSTWFLLTVVAEVMINGDNLRFIDADPYFFLTKTP